MAARGLLEDGASSFNVLVHWIKKKSLPAEDLAVSEVVGMLWWWVGRVGVVHWQLGCIVDKRAHFILEDQ